MMVLYSDNAVIRNNVFFTRGTTYTNLAVGCNNCTFENNLQFNPIGVLDSLPGVGNLDNVNPQFINMGSNYNNNNSNQRWDYNGDFDSQSNSPANTASSNNGKIGHLGGLGHFHPHGFSAVFPVIIQAIPENRIVPQGDPVIIRVEAQRGGL